MSNELIPYWMHKKPLPGQIVYYKLQEIIDPIFPYKADDIRPAMIVSTWSDSCIQLQVFLDGSNDSTDGKSLMWKTSVHQDQQEKKPGTWHWPEQRI